ncbi:collagen alpha-1(IV) chain-like [Eupeodes corollae]|uniref:collagen alpha-1(IV) chain-like n=1 Tax=Eupeodes corollae TaxID=290404 RepID=UPI0024931004|nr:collagen alpha-1(IV) chain-like [Eupeodes corollae]XP_055911975.1 collagen alpha-1(IV) chain-like [Eupeodes corollae]
MLRFWIVLLIVCCASAIRAEDSRWVWGKGNRNQRASFSNDEVPKYDNFYAREKDREPTTRKPPPGQTSQEDYLNPDDLRNYNGPPNFGYNPPFGGQGGGAPTNNFPPGYGPQQGANVPVQGNPNSGFPYPGGQQGFPGSAGGGYPGGYPQIPTNGFPNQGGYPNQGSIQGFPQPSGQGYPSAQGGYPGAYPGGFQGQQGGFQGQGGFPGQFLGGIPYPQQQVGGYPGQGGFPSQTGYPSQFPGGSRFPQGAGGQPPIGQYNGCGPFGGCGQQAQQPGQYPGQFPYPYPSGLGGIGQYPSFPEPFAHPHHAGNPYGVTPYNSNAGGQALSPSDDYEDLSKNGTDNTNSALKAEGKAFNSARSSQQNSSDTKLHKHKKA